MTKHSLIFFLYLVVAFYGIIFSYIFCNIPKLFISLLKSRLERELEDPIGGIYRKNQYNCDKKKERKKRQTDRETYLEPVSNKIRERVK